MPTLKEQIAQAKAAGYTDDQITEHLSSRSDLAPKIKQASEAGYKADQIVSHLAEMDSTPAAETKEAPGKTTTFGAAAGKGFGDVVLGAQKLLGMGYRKMGEAITPDKQSLSGLVSGKKDRGLIQSAGDWLVNDADAGKARNAAELAPYKAENPKTAWLGETTGNVVATAPVGGVLGKAIGSTAPLLAKVGVSAPVTNALASAVSSGGFKTGLPAAAFMTKAGLADLALRTAGGAITGGASGALIDPEHAGMSAGIGAALPGVLKLGGATAGYLGSGVKSLIQPLTKTGQEDLAAKVIQKFAEGGPMGTNTAQLVPGSLPTLAEATGNAGIAGLQRTARDIAPNAFVAREAGNANARNALFDSVAGSAEALKAAAASRGDVANTLYGKAFAADAMRRDLANSAQAARAPFAGVGLSGAADDLATPGLRELASRPQFQQAIQEAKTLAANDGKKLADPLQSLEGLHYIKLALDDALNPAAKSALGKNASNSVMGMRDKLADELAKVAPLYGNARGAFAEMSKPINAMEALQGLKLTNGRGEITLPKVQNAIDGLEKLRNAPGVNAAKSIAEDQFKALSAIRDDLLRQDKLGLGKSAGSNTFQNIATDNMLSTMLPGSLNGKVGGKLATGLGHVGNVVYKGSNDRIKNTLIEMMLDPNAAQAALSRRPSTLASDQLRAFAEMVGPGAYRAAPALSSSR